MLFDRIFLREKLGVFMKNKFLLSAVLTGAFLLSSTAFTTISFAAEKEEDPYKKVLDSFDPAMVGDYGDEIKSRSKEIETKTKEEEKNQGYSDSEKNTQVQKSLDSDKRLEKIKEAKEKYDGVISELGKNAVNQVKDINKQAEDPECRKIVNKRFAKSLEAFRAEGPLTPGSSEKGPEGVINQFYKIDPKTGELSYELDGASEKCEKAMKDIFDSVGESQKLKAVKTDLLEEESEKMIAEQVQKNIEKAKEFEESGKVDIDSMSPEEQAKLIADTTTSESQEEAEKRFQSGDIEFETGYMGSEDKGGGDESGGSGEEGGGGEKN